MWVPLHVHSQYSILDAAAPVEAIAKQAGEYGMPAVALTDHGNMFATVEFYKACKGAGVKPIIGCEVYVAQGSRHEKTRESGKRTNNHLVLLAKDDTGYHNLCKLSSIAYLEGFYYVPRIDVETLVKYKEGLICLSACLSGKIAQEILSGDDDSLAEQILWYKDLFGEDYYLELQRHSMSEADLQSDGMLQESWLYQQYQDFITKQTKVNAKLATLSHQYKIPLVATNDSHYMKREDWRAHEILLNVQSGEPCQIWEMDSLGNPKNLIPNPKRRTYASHECYFKSPQQMADLFHDLPEAISNTLLVAEKCKVELDFKTKHYPVYIPPTLEGTEYNKETQTKAVEEYLKKLCEEGIPKRYTPERLAKVAEVYPGQDPVQIVKDRLEYELSTIIPKGMCDYLLIVWDFINWAKVNDIPVGPGRGSGAGSIVLYLIGVTDIEPLRFHLFFERFINPERISYPDIDVDICMDKRGEVIQYTLSKYGKNNVAQIVTFGTMKAKSSIKDVGRVLNVPLAKVNAIAKLIPEDLNITLEKALEKEVELRNLIQTDPEANQVIDLAQKLEGSIRNTGIHAAGILISGEPLIEHIPIFLSKDSDEMPVSQFSMKPVEMVGMLKVDFLGLKTLTAIKICVDAIHQSTGRTIDWVNLPLDDQPTFEMLNQGKTLGVFQLESGGMQDLARQLHLDKFEEIIAVGALYRPGPMDMIPSFIARKHGNEAIEYDHPWMKDILSETYGIMVYQEQVMAIASKLANYSLGEGDVLRRAMGKKDAAQMGQEREKFRKGALENNIDEVQSMKIFDKMEKFASYGFNKSHAAAYGYLSYVTAYLKANYPKEWMASLMSCDSADLTKVAKFIRESQSMDIAILPPDINEAGKIFLATAQGIRFAMSGIKGIGEGVVDAIILERNKNGPFTSLYEFFKRLDPSKVGKKAAENLVNAGCFDFIGWTRDQLRLSIEPMFDSASKSQREAAMGVMSLFTLMGEDDSARFANPPKVPKSSTKMEELLREKELLGFFLDGHPMDAYKHILQRLSCVPLSKVEELPADAIFRSAFLIESVQVRFSSKSQRKFAILMVGDGIDSYELPVWPDLYQEKHLLLRENQLMYAILQVDARDGNPKLSCRWMDDLTAADDQMIAACDASFDKLKHQTNKMQFFKSKPAEKQAEQPKKTQQETMSTPSKPLVIALDANKMRNSHVLSLKNLFKEHAGTQPIILEFIAGSDIIATVSIDERWGVKVDNSFLQLVSSQPFVLKVG
ncbi:MAG: DNA polymerase III subunit alpha [Parachlamydiales bacterium]|jgi:DNA polymerase-3 subunit alpha